MIYGSAGLLPKADPNVFMNNEKNIKAVFYSQEICNNPAQCCKYEVKVVNEDCPAVAVRLKNEGYNPAVLNMASRRNPGKNQQYAELYS